MINFLKYFKENKSKKKILIVEDDEAISEFLSDHFLNKGIDVIIAKTGKEGLYLAKKEMPDLIILDIMLPEMSGFEVCQEIGKDKKVGKIPIIVMTAYINPKQSLLGKNLGVVEYITKPFSLDQLEKTINKYL